MNPDTRANVEKLCEELKSYAEDIRADWSEFDGRSLLYFVEGWLCRLTETLDTCPLPDKEEN